LKQERFRAKFLSVDALHIRLEVVPRLPHDWEGPHFLLVVGAKPDEENHVVIPPKPMPNEYQ
jgi:hypothetical protein